MDAKNKETVTMEERKEELKTRCGDTEAEAETTKIQRRPKPKRPRPEGAEPDREMASRVEIFVSSPCGVVSPAPYSKIDLNYREKSESVEVANLTSRIDYVMEDIQPGTHLRVLCGNIETPGHFYVILRDNWNRLEDLMDELEIHYRSTARVAVKYGNEYRTMPPFDMLQPGLPVGVRRSCDNKWHRGIILNQFPTENQTLRVYFIDYGDLEDVPLWNVQLIPKKFVQALKAQAIRCCAFVGKNYNKRTSTGLPGYFNSGGGWEEVEGDIMRDMVYDRTLALKFIEKEIDMDRQYWRVYIHMVDELTGKVTHLHVERSVLKEYRGTYLSDKDDENDNKNDIKFTKLSTA